MFSITMTNPTEKELKFITEAFLEMQHEMLAEQEELAEALNVSMACAADVQYLRTRSRWTLEKEKELIRLHKEGNPPNVLSGEF
jgi:hypothetical protein